MTDGGARQTGFSDVDVTVDPSYFIGYLDRGHEEPTIAAAKEWSLQQLNLAPGQQVLDVGCGTGEDVVAMAAVTGPTGVAVGVDSSTSMIEEARRRHGGVTGAQFKVADVQRLQFEPATFDACRSERTLQLLADPDRAVAEMTRVLRPGGRMALVEPDWETLVVNEPISGRARGSWPITSGATPSLGWAGDCRVCSWPTDSKTSVSLPVWSCTPISPAPIGHSVSRAPPWLLWHPVWSPTRRPTAGWLIWNDRTGKVSSSAP